MEKYLMDCWPGENHLEDAITWGVNPLFQLNEILDCINEEGSGPTKEQGEFFYFDRKSKLNNLKDVLYRYDLFQMLLERRLKELAPDDPLVVDTVNQVKKELQEREEAATARKAKAEKNEKSLNRLYDVMEKYKLEKSVVHDVLAEKINENRKVILLKMVDNLPDSEIEKTCDYLLALNTEPPEAENQTIEAGVV